MLLKILYIMHVDWDWIKQRPHFLAEHLSKVNRLFILYPFFKRRTALTKNEKKQLHAMPFVFLPFRTHYSWVYAANKILMKTFFALAIVIFRPQSIWLTSPEFMDYIWPKKGLKIIYDCMDDVSQFDGREAFKERLLRCEKKLIRQSSCVFVSSNYLGEQIKQREKCKDKMVVVRNAFEGPMLDSSLVSLNGRGELPREVIRIGYVGTIASWFDLEILHVTLSHFENIEYHLIGPSELKGQGESTTKIRFYGPVNHHDMYSYVETFDILIMPFKMCELVQSVDPVKLYEYINFGKPIISVYYPELVHFLPFAYWYSSEKELIAVIDALLRSGCQPKYGREQRVKFLQENSWSERTKQISHALQGLG